MKPEDFKKELVWNLHNVFTRIVLVEYPDGSCVAVTECDEDKFLQENMAFCTCEWNHHKPIPEKKIRPMTREEILIDNLNHPRRLVKFEKNDWFFIGYWRYNNMNTGDYTYMDIPEGYEGDFSDLPVKKYEIEE